MKHYRSSKGFTLIELAVVIAVIGILAAVALTRFAGMDEAAEMGICRDMMTQMTSGVSLYTARMAQLPPGADDFVTDTTANLSNDPAGNDYFTVSVENFGPNGGGGGGCAIAAGAVTCAGALSALTNCTFSYNAASGIVSGTYVPGSGGAAQAL